MDMNRRSFLRGLFGGAVAAIAAPYVPTKTYSFLGGILRPREELIAEGFYRKEVWAHAAGPRVFINISPIKLFKRGERFRYECDVPLQAGRFDLDRIDASTTNDVPTVVYRRGLEELLLDPVVRDETLPGRPWTLPFQREIIPPLRERC